MAELAAMRQAKEQLKRRVEGTTGELAQSKLRVRELEAECARLREEVCHSIRKAKEKDTPKVFLCFPKTTMMQRCGVITDCNHFPPL